MTLITIFSLLLIHYVGDFVCQTHEQAMNKSTSTRALTEHIMTYILIWWTAGIAYCVTNMSNFVAWNALLFLVITFVCHWITDYFTSKWTKHFFTRQDYHNGFVVVGIDQILHYVQIFLCFKYLIL